VGVSRRFGAELRVRRLPGQVAVPYANESGQLIHNDIKSPLIALYAWATASACVSTCTGTLTSPAWCSTTGTFDPWLPGARPWKDFGNLYYGSARDWHQHNESIGALIDPDATHIQIALGVVDMASQWTGVYGNGACHSHAPLFDNVVVYRREDGGLPQIHVGQEDLFQDTFADPATGTGRVDIARDIAPPGRPQRLARGLDGGHRHGSRGVGSGPVGIGPAVYMAVRVRWANPVARAAQC